MGIIEFFKRAMRREGAGGSDHGGRSEAAFRLLAEQSVDVIFHVRGDGIVRYISPSAEQLFGWTPAEMMARGGTAAANSFLHPDDAPMVSQAIARHFANEVADLKLEFRIMRRGDVPVWVETNARTVVDPDTGQPTDLVFTMRDISEKKAREIELAAAARTDALTGIANRRAFDEALAKHWQATLNDGAYISLLLLDIDHFKAFNDSYGHQVGDDCLRAVALAVARSGIDESGLVARYGGEEIAVILPGHDAARAVEVAERIRAAICALGLPHKANDTGNGLVTASIGVATAVARAGGSTKMPEGLLAAADQALYRAKSAGRNRVETALLLAPTND